MSEMPTGVVPPSPAASEGRPEAATPRPKSRAPMFFLGAFSGCAVLFFAFFFFAFMAAIARPGTSNGFDFSVQKVAVVPIEGEILDARDTVDLLRKYAKMSTVRAIVVRINSPGGAIAPSQEIYSEIRKLHQSTGKPFVASIDSVGASGGYYIASACGDIVADPGSITGSIGVILDYLEYGDLLQWAKMKHETLTSGAFKAAGAPFKELTDPERQYLQRIVMQLHHQFVQAVADGRAGRITEPQVAALADGRVFTGEEALSLHLIDKLGNLGDAVTLAARKAGVHGEPSTIYPRKRGRTLLDLITDTDDTTHSLIERIATRPLPRFLYRW